MRVRVIARKPDGKLGEKYARRWFMSSLATAPGTYLRTRFASPIQQLFKLAHTAGIEGDDFAVENGAPCSQSGQSFPQDFKTLVGVSSARNQTTVAVFEIGEGPEAIVLLEEPIGMIEWFQRSSELGRYNRREHTSIFIMGHRPPKCGRLIREVRKCGPF